MNHMKESEVETNRCYTIRSETNIVRHKAAQNIGYSICDMTDELHGGARGKVKKRS